MTAGPDRSNRGRYSLPQMIGLIGAGLSIIPVLIYSIMAHEKPNSAPQTLMRTSRILSSMELTISTAELA